MSDEKVTKAAKALAKLGAAKGGRARASVLTPTERSEIASKAVIARWKKAKGEDYQAPVAKETPPEPSNHEDPSPSGSNDGDLPFSMFPGELVIGDLKLPCHVLNNRMRVLTQRGMVNSLGMARGSSGGTGGDRLSKFVAGKILEPFVSNKLREVTEKPMLFRAPGGQVAYAYEATVLVDLCEAVLAARAEGALQTQQEHIARVCEILIRSFAKTGIIALVDEATGYQEVRQKQALRLKLQAFITDDIQEWARMFPEEFWLELARLEGVRYSPRSRPLRWGKYVMAFVYDSIDRDVGKKLREINPNPHFRMNHHQWLKVFGRERVNNQLQRVIAILKLCRNMEEFKTKFARVFAKSGFQFSFEDINWGIAD